MNMLVGLQNKKVFEYGDVYINFYEIIFSFIFCYCYGYCWNGLWLFEVMECLFRCQLCQISEVYVYVKSVS